MKGKILRIRLLAVLLTVAIVAALVPAVGVSAQAVWHTDRLIEDNTGFNQYRPQVAVSGLDAIAVWVGYDAENNIGRIYYAYSTDGGASWSGPMLLENNTGYDAASPQIAMFEKTAVVVWQQFDGSHYRIYHNTTWDGGISWTGDELIEDNAGFDGLDPSVAIDGIDGIYGIDGIDEIDGLKVNVVVVWRQFEAAGNYRICSNYSDDGGLSWHDDLLVENNGGENMQGGPDVAISGLNVVAIWCASQGGRWNILSNWSLNGGEAWQDDQPIEDNDGNAFPHPQVAINGSNAVAVWGQYESPAWSIFCNNSVNGGDTWQGDRTIEDNPGSVDMYPQVAMSADTVVAVWSQEDGGNDHVCSNYSSNGGVAWHDAQQIESNTEYSAYHSQLAVAGANVVAVWQQYDGAYEGIYSNCSPDGGANWQVNAQQIKSNGNDSSYPQVAMSGSEAGLLAVAVWEQSDGYYTGIAGNNSANGGIAWGGDQYIAGGGWVRGDDPQVAMYGANAVAVWSQDEGSIPGVYVNFSSNSGADWNQDQRINDTMDFRGRGAQVAIDGQNAVAVWQQNIDFFGFDTRIYANTSPNGGASWSGDVCLSAGNPGSNPQVAINDDAIVAIWEYPETGDDRSIRYNRSTDGGVTWLGEQVLRSMPDTPENLEAEPQIAMSGENIVAVWMESDGGVGGNLAIFSSWSTNGGAVWNTAQRISASTTSYTNYPQVALSGNNAVAVWEQDLDGFTRVYRNYSSNGGSTWSGSTAMSAPGFGAQNPQVAMDGVRAVAVWAQLNGVENIYCAFSTDGGVSWNPAQAIEDNGTHAGLPQVGISGSNVVVVWVQDMGGDPRRAFSNCSTDGGATWYSDQMIEDNGKRAERPQVAVSGANAAAVWDQSTDEEGINMRIYANYAFLAATAAPQPEELWTYEAAYDISDVAVGKIADNTLTDDVVAIDYLPNATIYLLLGEGDGHGNADASEIGLESGYAVAAGDIDGDSLPEIVAGKTLNSNIVAYEDNGTFKWEYNAAGEVKDIEIADVDGDGTKDVVACDKGPLGWVYVLDGITGTDLTGWPPQPITGEDFLDAAAGQLDGLAGADVAVVGRGLVGSLYVYNSAGEEIFSTSDQGRTVEIGDVDGDSQNEVVVGNDRGWVKVYKYSAQEGFENAYSFYHSHPVSDLDLGNLDEDPDDMEIACIFSDEIVEQPETVYALNLNDTGDLVVMWSYPISWNPEIGGDRPYYGEAIAIGDVDHDYKNEVVAACGGITNCVFAFDAEDKNGDGLGDLVWSPYQVAPRINDLELGDFDADGDLDVAFGTNHLDELPTVYAIKAVDNMAPCTTGGDAQFDSDPSSLGDLVPLLENTLPTAGKPNYEFPFGFFSFTISGLPVGATPAVATVTVTLSGDVPVGAKWVKCEGGVWTVLDIGDDDGDNIITFQLTDTDQDGTINDPGAPGIYRGPEPLPMGIGGEVAPVNSFAVIAPWLLLCALLLAGGTLLVASRRKAR